MKQLLACSLLLVFTVNGFSQGKHSYIDSVEKTFESVRHSTGVACSWRLDRKLDADNKPYFINENQTRLDFSFFNAPALPFYGEMQTDFETTAAYFNWFYYNSNVLKDVDLVKLEENKDSSYMLLKLKAGAEDLYRIVSRYKNVFYSITVASKEFPNEEQIVQLKFLMKLNKSLYGQ